MSCSKNFLIGLVLAIYGTMALAEGTSLLIDGSTLKPLLEEDLSHIIQPGEIVILTEIHLSKAHHENQIRAIRNLQDATRSVHVGMEFFSWPQQFFVDQFLAGKMNEVDFLSAIQWKGQPFDDYRWQVLLPALTGSSTRALNAPRTLTSKVASLGFASLTPNELELLPPHFSFGNELYRERFVEIMKDHVPPEKLNNYFAAQSIWDDTMAHQACDFQLSHPQEILLVIVGDFHGIYGGGLPDRLRARGCEKVKVISQVLRDNFKGLEEDPEIQVSPKYGPRADFIWISKEKGRVDRPSLMLMDLLNGQLRNMQ